MLALILVLLVPVIGSTSQFSADEGAALAQAVRLERGDGWTMANSFPAADPDGAAFPFELSARSNDRFAPFAKHPVYPAILSVADRVGGRTAIVLLSVAGTVAAAVLSALLARRLDPALAVPALWTVGIASPLFFDGYVVIAHTLGAACAAGAALLLLRALDEPPSWLAAGAAGVLVVIGVLLRTEMLFLGLALAVAVAIVGTARRTARSWAVALFPAAAVVVGLGLDRVLQRIVLHGAGTTTASVAIEPGGLVTGRLIAFVITWLLPSYSLGAGAAIVLLVAVMAAVAVLLARRTPPERDGVRLFAVVAAIAAVARLALGGSTVPGLLVAFPLLLAGIASLRRDTFRDPTARFLAITVGLFAAGVLATQYGNGGSGEWGGRYFAIGLPLAAPVLVLALRDIGLRLDRTTARIALGSALAISIASGALAVVTLRDSHQDIDRVVASVDGSAQHVAAGDGGPPVVLTTSGALARFAFPLVDRYRWLTVPPDRLADYAQRLRDLDVGPVTFVSRNPSEDLRKVDGLYTANDRREPAEGWTVATLAPCVTPNGCSPTR